MADQDERLPGYEPMLAAYHAAFAPELRAMIAGLPIRPGDRVADMACGDGAYSPWLAERVGPAGLVVAVDASTAYLERAREGAKAERVGFIAAALERLPFPDDTFDLVWCAQSLYSLPEPVAAVRRMARVVRPGGVVAVLENDTLHQIILPWPVEVELVVRAAELAAVAKRSDRPRKYYVGRRLRQVFADAGLVDCHERTRASDRLSPLGETERAFLSAYLRDLADRAGPELDRDTRATFERLIDGDSPDGMLNWPDFAATVIDHVVWGIKPGPATARESGR
jgi:SAM-dependent methyltransferase